MRNHETQRGSAIVEFALALPVLLVLCFGVIEASWFFHNQLSATQAVSDGARLATVTPQGENFEALVRERVEQRLRGARVDEDAVVIAVVIRQDGAGDDEVVVTMDAPYPPLIGLIPTPMRLRGFAVAHLEDQR